MAKLAGQFQRGLVGFQPCGAEKHVFQTGQLNQFGGQRFLQRHMVVVGAMNHLADLCLQGGHQPGVVVAQRVDCNAAEPVQVALAVDVPHAAAVAV